MAIKQINVSHDFLKLGVIKDALQNPLTTAARTTLAGTLGASNKGLAVYDTDEAKIYHWNGTAFATNPTITSGLVPQGNVAFNATEPGSPSVGWLYVFNTAGTNTWGGGSNVVQIGDQAWWDGTTWQFIQGNVIAASETVAGIAEIATQAETNTGTDDATTITPLKQKGYHDNRKVARAVFAGSITLVANTPLTCTYDNAIQNRDAFTWNFMVSNSSVDVDVDSIGTTSCSVTSNIAATGFFTVIGF